MRGSPWLSAVIGPCSPSSRSKPQLPAIDAHCPSGPSEKELLASLLEDKLRFVFREYVRGAVVLLRQLFLSLHHLAGEANDHVVLIGLSVDRDGSECRAFDLHGRDPYS